MRTNPYNNYFENEILSADPMTLVVLMYRGALDSLASARRHLAAGDIRSRSRSITKATEIIAELVRSLDHEKGGELSRNLERVYDYVLSCLSEANIKQIDGPLAQAEKVMTTLMEGWVSQQRSEVENALPYVAPAARGYDMAPMESQSFSYAY